MAAGAAGVVGAIMVVFGPEPGGMFGAAVEVVRSAWDLVF